MNLFRYGIFSLQLSGVEDL